MKPQKLHIKNLEKYHPGYKDRHLIWFKFYFKMLDGDDRFEMLDEIDKWRFVSFIVLELRTKEPVSLDKTYLSRKGFDFKKKKLEKTLEALSPFIEICNNGVTECNDTGTHIRIEENRIDKDKEEKKKHPTFTSVLLTDEQLKKLKDKFPHTCTKKLESLDRYSRIKPKIFNSYKSHYDVILNWARNEPAEEKHWQSKGHDEKPQKREIIKTSPEIEKLSGEMTKLVKDKPAGWQLKVKQKGVKIDNLRKDLNARSLGDALKESGKP